MLVLIDRDGVLNRDRSDLVKSPEELDILPGAPEAVAALTRAGHATALVTNQSVVGRGLIDLAMLERIHDKLQAAVAAAGGRIDRIYVCADPPWAAGPRRKPAPGMLIEAMSDFRASPADTVMIGDAKRDLEAAAGAGVRRLLVLTGKGAATRDEGWPTSVDPVEIHADLAAAARALTGKAAA